MKACPLGMLTALALAVMLSSCGISPYQRCNVDKSYWRYVSRLDDIDIEARRTVTERATSELLHGETQQFWFRHSASELFVCRTSRNATDFCFSDRDWVNFENGQWHRHPPDDTGSTVLCTS